MITIEAGNNVPKNNLIGRKGGTLTFWATSNYAKEFGGNVWHSGDISQETGHRWAYCDKFEQDDIKSVRFNIQISENDTNEERTARFIIFNEYDEDAILEITQTAEESVETPKQPTVQKPKKEPVLVDVTKIPKKPWYLTLLDNIREFFRKLFK